ncbi:hypothetical protein SCFA_620016 [anaerobic digester metagenome]|uniref:Uncharacterized protein n=1 Tax=anaerobic digester metagenome TaxID=1263854 RepID=A0A485M2Y9_9ZZZZ
MAKDPAPDYPCIDSNLWQQIISGH